MTKSKTTNTTAEDVRVSVGSIYAELLNKRKIEREEKEEQKRVEAEARQKEKEEKEEKYVKEDGTKMTKKERREAELDNWKEIVVGLTGDDLEYSSKKSKKKKYRKWIGDEDTGTVTTVKPKKAKKRNYNKEFEPELNMLRTLVSEQNRFTADLQRRFQYAAGPASKDAMAPNKTMVELAAAITSGRSNSLGMLREIGSLKKTIADLYMKQKKLDNDLGASSQMDSTDIGLMGSNIAANMFNFGGGNPVMDTPISVPPSETPVGGINPGTPTPPDQDMMRAVINTPIAPAVPGQAFDPSSWDGPQLTNTFTQFENIPHTIVVEKNRTTGDMRFVALRDDTGEEIIGCNVPTINPSELTVNEKDMTVKGQFDEVYNLRLVG